MPARGRSEQIELVRIRLPAHLLDEGRNAPLR
jgi:hypothetical protein